MRNGLSFNGLRIIHHEIQMDVGSLLKCSTYFFLRMVYELMELTVTIAITPLYTKHTILSLYKKSIWVNKEGGYANTHLRAIKRACGRFRP
jgi:hypothetical protein